MAKKVAAVVRFHVPAGKAMAGPPVGPALAPHGVNVMEFVKAYNTQTASQVGSIIPVEVTVYGDRSFTFILKTPPASELLKKAAGLEKGAKQAGREDAGQVSRDQIADIARQKMRDLNTDDLEQAIRVIEGTARSMGITVV
jgi:large subunit ribosomal protein L11